MTIRLNKYEEFKNEIKKDYIRFLSQGKIQQRFGMNRKQAELYINRLKNEGACLND